MSTAREQTSLRSISLLSVCSLAQLILQFAFQVLLAHLYGTQADMDAYLAALAIPTVVSTVLVGSLGFTFVPVFLETRQQRGDDAAWNLASTIGIMLFVSSLAISAVCCVFAESLMGSLFKDSNAELSAELFRVLAWTVLTSNMATFLRAVCHCCQRFTPTGIAPVAGTVTTIGYVVAFHSAQGILAVAYAFLAGTVVSTVVQLPLFLRNVRWAIRFDEDVQRCGKLLLPLIAGAVYYNLDPIIDRHLASSVDGQVSRLGYASRLAGALVTVATTGLAVVVFPKLSQLASDDDPHRFRSEVASAFRFLGFVIIPILAGLAFFSQPVVHDLFERGKFTPSDTAAVAGLIILYLGMILAASLGEVAARVFYALQDTRTPVLIGMTGFTLGLVVKFWLAPTYGISAIAAATSGYFVFNIGCMLVILRKRLTSAIFAGVGRMIGRSFAASSAAVAAAWAIIGISFAYSSFVAAVLGLTVYVAVSYALGDEFAVASMRYLLGKRPPTNEIDSQE